MSIAIEALPQELRQRGVRATAARIAVYRAVAEATDHPGADAITDRVRELIGTVSTQAVYDTLHALTGAGLLRRIEPAGGPARFETRVGDNHHHMVCRSCGVVHDVDCASASAPCLSPAHVGEFAVDEAEVTFWGLCADCRPS